MSPESKQSEHYSSQKSSFLNAGTISAVILSGTLSTLATWQYMESQAQQELVNAQNDDRAEAVKLKNEIATNRITIKELTDHMRDQARHEVGEFQILERRKTEYENALKDPWALNKNKDAAVAQFRYMTSQCGTLLVSHAMLLSKMPDFHGRLHMLWIDMQSRLIDLERDIRRPEPSEFFELDKGRKVSIPLATPQVARTAVATPRYMQGKRSA